MNNIILNKEFNKRLQDACRSDVEDPRRVAVEATFGTAYKDKVLEQIQITYGDLSHSSFSSTYPLMKPEITGVKCTKTFGFEKNVAHPKELTIHCMGFDYLTDFTINNVSESDIERIELLVPGKEGIETFEYPVKLRQPFANHQYAQISHYSRLRIVPREHIDFISVTLSGLMVSPEMHDALYYLPYSTPLTAVGKPLTDEYEPKFFVASVNRDELLAKLISEESVELELSEVADASLPTAGISN
jgi:hypothetical protein